MDLMTPEQAEDAAAEAMGDLFMEALARQVEITVLDLELDGAQICREDITAVCRELLRGPLDEDYSRRPGGYCMRAPRDPGLRELGRYGARLVELSYTARDLEQALLEAGPLPPLSGVGTREERS